MQRPSAIESCLKEYLEQIVGGLKSRFGGDLVSVVLFGSFARGEAGEGSDIDLLVVSQSFSGSLGSRFEVFNELEKQLLPSDARKRLRASGFGTLISPVPLTPDELKKNPPIILDLLTDAIIAYDRDEFMRNYLREIELKLKELGAKKVQLPSGKRYWDLKPTYRLGEDVEI